MEKPISIKVTETEEQLIKIVNKAGLSATLLKFILKDIFAQLNNIENAEINEYQKIANRKENKTNEIKK